MDFKEYEKKAESLKNEYTKEAYENYQKYVGPINKDSGHNDDLDAYRHAYVAAKLTQLLAGTQWAAEVILDAHEVSSKNVPYEHRMDGWNNEVGRRFGDKYDSDELGKQLAKELKPNGLLVTSPNDPRLEVLYSSDPKLKDPKLLDREKDGQAGVTEKEMDKITDDASKEIDTLMQKREEKLISQSKEALPIGIVLDNKDMKQYNHTSASIDAGKAFVADLNLSTDNSDSNEQGYGIGD